MPGQLTTNTHVRPTRDESDKYVLFGLAGETYCINLLQLQEVIANYTITALPNLPDFFHGVIGVRGDVIPVVNLRRRFGFPETPSEASTRLLIIDLEPNPIGVQVDRVYRVVTIGKSRIGQPPQLTSGKRTPFVVGISEYERGKLAIHLDMREVLSNLEKLELADLTESIRATFRPLHSAESIERSEPVVSPSQPQFLSSSAKPAAGTDAIETVVSTLEKGDTSRPGETDTANPRTTPKRGRKRVKA